MASGWKSAPIRSCTKSWVYSRESGLGWSAAWGWGWSIGDVINLQRDVKTVLLDEDDLNRLVGIPVHQQVASVYADGPFCNEFPELAAEMPHL